MGDETKDLGSGISIKLIGYTSSHGGVRGTNQPAPLQVRVLFRRKLIRVLLFQFVSALRKASKHGSHMHHDHEHTRMASHAVHSHARRQSHAAEFGDARGWPGGNRQCSTRTKKRDLTLH